MSPEKKLTCFVLMPSGNNREYAGGKDEADSVYQDIIKPAVEQALGSDAELIREIDNRNSGAITTSIIRNIARADVVIVDITGHNANVFFELGIRYSLRRNGTILMRQAAITEIPFDIKVYRMIDYSPFRRDQAIAQLSSYISVSVSASQQERVTDSLVYDVLSSMQVQFNDALDGDDLTPPMPWRVYWDRLSRIVAKLREASVEGRYRPDVVIGITNGGAISADLLGRQVGYRCPILSLWANRDETDYFSNKINDALCEALLSLPRKSGEQTHWPHVLLVDDIIASGHTYRRAKDYLQNRLPNADISFMPLFFRNQANFSEAESLFIWRKSWFNLDYTDIAELHRVNWNRLPYDKDIRAN